MPDSSPMPLPDVPGAIKQVRLGYCYDRAHDRLLQAWVFEPDQLSPTSIQFTSGRADLHVSVNASTHESALETLFRLNTKANAGYDSLTVSARASVEFNMEQAKASNNRDQSLNVICSYLYTGQRIDLNHGLTGAPLLKLTNESFRNAYEAVVTARDAAEYVAAYRNFVKAYGDGCVTTVYLAAGSAFRLTLARTDSAEANSQKYGTSVSVIGSYYGASAGASAASDWAEQRQRADSQAALQADSASVPEDAPTKSWAEGMVEKFTDTALDILTKDREMIKPPQSVSPLEAPALPSSSSYDPSKQVPEVPVPADRTADDTTDITAELRKALMTEDGFKEGDWDKYQAEQELVYKSITASNVAKEAAGLAGVVA